MFHAFEKAYGNIENGDSHRYEKALKEGLCGEPDTGKESSSYNRHYVWTEENYHTADGATTKKLHYAYDVYNRNVSVTGDDFTQKNHYDAEGLPRFHHRKGQGHKLCISGWNAPSRTV